MNIDNIGVSKAYISDIFNPEQYSVYEIPKYQREYTWGKKNWEDLYTDLLENDRGYFLGTIICINEINAGVGELLYEVIDGQQRLTTLSIFLIALYSEFSKHRDEMDEEQLIDLISLKRKLIYKNSNSTRLIPQIQNNNREDYMYLLAKNGIIDERPKPKFAGNRRMLKAYHFFVNHIEETIEEADDLLEALNEIYEKVNNAITVFIKVNSHSDAFTLFESLNDRGTPLSSVDLMKNLVLAQIDKMEGESIDDAFDRWQDILKNLGEDDADQERFFRQNYNAFRAYYNKEFLVDDRKYPLGTIATRSTLLGIYEKIIKSNPKKFLSDIYKNSVIYGQIILANTDGISDELVASYQDLIRIQGTPSRLLLLNLLSNREEYGLTEEIVLEITKLLTSFFVRRNLTDIPPTRDVERMFMSFIEAIEKNGYKGREIYLELRKRIISVSASDAIFEERLRGPVYIENTGAVRFILCKLAEKGMTRETKVDLWSRTGSCSTFLWTIEHIFPQGENIPKCWVDMIADGDEEKAKEYRTLYTHTLGNLTITGYNSALGNKSFEYKRDRVHKNGLPKGYNNGLNLNEDIVNKDKWTIDEIKARTDKLAEAIVKEFQM